MKKQKGVTLVSLVVTIIVLIILATITINATLGENGIITIARQAKENMELAQDDEQAELNELYTQMEAEGGTSGGISYDAIAKLTEFQKIIAEAITNNGVQTSQADSAETMADNIDKIRKDGNSESDITLDDLKAGAYIKYDTGITNIGDNGVIMCRVLYRASSEYGLQIITDKNITQKVNGVDTEIKLTLGSTSYSDAVKSYNNAITTLNDAVEVYINEDYVADARCVGSLPTVNSNGTFTKKDSGATTYLVPEFTHSGYINTLNADTNYTTDKTAMDTANIWTTGERYWLASRLMEPYTDGNKGYNFFVRTVLESGSLGGGSWCGIPSHNPGYGGSATFGLRPCFSLKSDLKITGGDGTTEATAYTIANY